MLNAVLMLEKEMNQRKNSTDAALALLTLVGCWDTKCRKGNKVT